MHMTAGQEVEVGGRFRESDRINVVAVEAGRLHQEVVPVAL
jgi:hypothetical protein